ncbi:MAG TPA: hypothetical protein VFL76_04845 [Edaphocola sp.]|nr:hypothetical protein [Edaphocola sp.]
MGGNKILILGVQPPPIGGVTIHVKRLCEQLMYTSFDWVFADIKKTSKIRILSDCLVYKNIHLHSSNPYLRFLISAFCFLFRKRLLVTFHGNLGRYGRFKNWLDCLTARYCFLPIVLNENSLSIAKRFNKKALLITAFIPVKAITPLQEQYIDLIEILKKNCKQIFCTNASYVGFDANGKEIYQITDVIAVFNSQPQKGLIISDPSGKYNSYLKSQNVSVGRNIILITEPHDFNAIIKLSDAMLRFTTTDGDSVSVREALSLRKPVIATNVVSRPRGVTLISPDVKDLEDFLNSNNIKAVSDDVKIENAFDDLQNVYRSIL